MNETRQDDILERVLLREVELARANEALRHEHFERLRIEKTREIFAGMGEKLIDAAAPRDAALTILEAADQLFGWDAAFVDVYSEQDKRFHPVVRFDVKSGKREELVPGSGSVAFTPLREQLFQQGPVLILRPEEPDAPEEWLLSFGSEERKSASLMFVPMSRAGKIIGVLSIQSYEQNAYSRADLDLLQVLGNYCCHGLQRGFAEMRLRNVQQKLELMQSITSIAMWTVDQELRILRVEGSGWQKLQLSPEQIAGQTIAELFGGKSADISILIEAHRRALDGESASFEIQVNGQAHRCRVEPLADDRGRVPCCIGVLAAE